MKKIKISALLLVALMVCGCNGGTPSDKYVDENGTPIEDENYVDDFFLEEEEDEEEPEYDYDAAVAAEEIKALNVEAENFAKSINGFLSEAAAGGYGMMEGSTLVTAYVEEGLWIINVEDTDCFALPEDGLEWWGYGEADASTDKALAEDNDTLLAIWLCEAFPNITDASVGAWLENGECKAVYYTDDTTTGDIQIEFMMGKGGWIAPSCEWDGYNQGVSDDGNFVGTYPILGFEVIE